MANQPRKDWIQVEPSGGLFRPLDPSRFDVRIEDIARALSMQCRFGGHVQRFMSVAEHSVNVSWACDPADALWGLMHDAAEAYIGDLVSPIKHQPSMLAYRNAEYWLEHVICVRFGLRLDMPPSVKRADEMLLKAEAYALKSPVLPDWSEWLDGIPDWPGTIVGLAPGVAEALFLDRFRELTAA